MSHPTTDKFAGQYAGDPGGAPLTAAAGTVYGIAPSDSTDLTSIPRFLYIGGAGNLRFDPAEGGSTVTVAVIAGVCPFRPKRIYSTSTTATGIFGCE